MCIRDRRKLGRDAMRMKHDMARRMDKLMMGK